MDNLEVEFIARDGGVSGLRQMLPTQQALQLIAKGIARPAPPKTHAGRSAAAKVPAMRVMMTRDIPAPDMPEGVLRFMSRIERNTGT
jgi:hypothetical protein